MLSASDQKNAPSAQAILKEISNRNFYKAIMLVNSNPKILREQDEDGYTLLHHLIIRGTKSEIITIFLGILENRNEINLVLSTSNNDDNTILHLAAKYSEIEIIRYLIQLLGKKSALMCQSTNIEGKTPLLLVEENPIYYQHEAVKALLLAESIKFKCPPLSQAIDEKEVFKNFADVKLDIPFEKIILACVKAVNKTRQNNLYSTSHPQGNNADDATITNNIVQLNSVRKRLARIPYIGDNQEMTARLAARAAIIRNKKSGNCDELAEDAAAYLTQDPDCVGMRIEIVHFQRNFGATGSHVFLILKKNTFPDLSILVDPFSQTITRVNPGLYESPLTWYRFENMTNLIAYPNKQFPGHVLRSTMFFNNEQKACLQPPLLIPYLFKKKLLRKFTIFNKTQPPHPEAENKDPQPRKKPIVFKANIF